MASTKLTKSYSTTGNRRTHTVSFWVKFCNTTTANTILNIGPFSGDQEYRLTRNASGTLEFYDYGSGAYRFRYRTHRLFRDANAWYHIVCAVDTTQAAADERVKIYVNGVQETSFDVGTHPSQNFDTAWGIANNYTLAATESGNFLDGILSHFHYADGSQLAPTVFGQYDANGVWTIKTSPSFTPGTNGFTILKDGNSVTDQSGNGNNFTVAGGTLTNTEDSPSNVFATLNPLDKGYTGTIVLANGNTTTMNSTGAGDYGLRSTIGVNSGKYYWEVKTIDSDAFAILPMEAALKFDMFGSTPEPDLYGIQRSTDTLTNFFDDTSFISGNTAWGGITSSDVTGFALDMDNGKLFLSKNGVFKNISGTSSDPVAGTNPTFTISDTSKTYGFYIELRTNANNGIKVNFGNGYFGTTAVASAGTNASGIGIFEYDVPTGYTALSTKGLNL